MEKIYLYDFENIDININDFEKYIINNKIDNNFDFTLDLYLFIYENKHKCIIKLINLYRQNILNLKEFSLLLLIVEDPPNFYHLELKIKKYISKKLIIKDFSNGKKFESKIKLPYDFNPNLLIDSILKKKELLIEYNGLKIQLKKEKTSNNLRLDFKCYGEYSTKIKLYINHYNKYHFIKQLNHINDFF